MDNPLMIYYAHRPLQFYKLTDLNVFIAHRFQCLYCTQISMSLLHTDLTDLTDLPMLRMAHG